MSNQPRKDRRNEDNRRKAGKVAEPSKMTAQALALPEEASRLAQQLFGNNIKEYARFTNRLRDIYHRAQGKDFLLVHNPGGWGSTPLEHLLQWERSIVDGVSASIERLGYSWLLIQYFRSGRSWWSHFWELREQSRFFFKGIHSKARLLAAELEFVTRHINNLRIILIGISQGAAFGNAVMRQPDGLHRVYSIELGICYPHASRRVVTERTLAMDSNGLTPDLMIDRNLRARIRVFITALFQWFKYQLQGKPAKFSHLINLPGHEYSWEHPEVQQQISDFLEINFGTKSNLKAGVP